MVGDFIICLLAFSNIFIFLFIHFLFNKKKRGPERGPEGGPKRGPKGGSRKKGPRFVYTQASLSVFAFFKDELLETRNRSKFSFYSQIYN